MSKRYAILPCNGLDKCSGCMTREIALQLSAKTDSEILCPVFYRVSDGRYNRLAQELPLLVLDGCATRCASKLAAEKNVKVAEKINISDVAKDKGITLPNGLRLGAEEEQLVAQIVSELLQETKRDEAMQAGSFYPSALEYEIYRKDKFAFRLPTREGFFFNENDVWVYVAGNQARIGITDFVQKSLADIMFFYPPDLNAEVTQFDELGSIESGKAVYEIVSPVSGRITAINEALLDAPELLNQNPYEQGWIVEMELSDFTEDQELLHTFAGYFPILKRKVDEFHV